MIYSILNQKASFTMFLTVFLALSPSLLFSQASQPANSDNSKDDILRYTPPEIEEWPVAARARLKRFNTGERKNGADKDNRLPCFIVGDVTDMKGAAWSHRIDGDTNWMFIGAERSYQFKANHIFEHEDDDPTVDPGGKTPLKVISKDYIAIEKIKVYDKKGVCHSGIAAIVDFIPVNTGEEPVSHDFEVYTTRVGIEAFRPRTESELKLEDEEEPEKIILQLNSDNDEEKKVKEHDYDDKTFSEKDNDLYKLILDPLQPKVNTGALRLIIPEIEDDEGEKFPAIRLYYENDKKEKVPLEEKEHFLLNLDNPPGKHPLKPLINEKLTLWVEGLLATPKDEPAKLIYMHTHETDDPTSEEFILHKDEIHFLISKVDLDVDSDNDDEIEFDDPEEDDIENPKRKKDIKKYPGKIISVNVDEVEFDPENPDFVFVPIKLRLAGNDNIKRNNVKFLFKCSDKFRFWKAEDKSFESLDPNTKYSGSEVPEDLYIEALPGAEELKDALITVEVYSTDEAYEESEWVLDDTVRVVVAPRVDLDVDSNNNGVVDINDNDEDKIENPQTTEDKKKYPGRIFGTNHNDLDEDGIPDFADGINNYPGTDDDDISTMKKLPFIELKLEVDGSFKQENIEFSFNYKASPPKRIGRNLSTTPYRKYTYSAPRGFRIWKINSSSRNKNSVSNGGDYVKPKTKLTAAQIGMTDGKVTLYIEATPGTETFKNKNRLVTVRVTPIDTSEKWGLEDTVRIAAIKIEPFRNKSCTKSLNDWVVGKNITGNVVVLHSPKYSFGKNDYIFPQITGPAGLGDDFFEIRFFSESDPSAGFADMEEISPGVYRQQLTNDFERIGVTGNNVTHLNEVKIVDEENFSFKVFHINESHWIDMLAQKDVMIDRNECAFASINQFYEIDDNFRDAADNAGVFIDTDIKLTTATTLRNHMLNAGTPTNESDLLFIGCHGGYIDADLNGKWDFGELSDGWLIGDTFGTAFKPEISGLGAGNWNNDSEWVSIAACGPLEDIRVLAWLQTAFAGNPKKLHGILSYHIASSPTSSVHENFWDRLNSGSSYVKSYIKANSGYIWTQPWAVLYATYAHKDKLKKAVWDIPGTRQVSMTYRRGKPSAIGEWVRADTKAITQQFRKIEHDGKIVYIPAKKFSIPIVKVPVSLTAKPFYKLSLEQFPKATQLFVFDNGKISLEVRDSINEDIILCKYSKEEAKELADKLLKSIFGKNNKSVHFANITTQEAAQFTFEDIKKRKLKPTITSYDIHYSHMNNGIPIFGENISISIDNEGVSSALISWSTILSKSENAYKIKPYQQLLEDYWSKLWAFVGTGIREVNIKDISYEYFKKPNGNQKTDIMPLALLLRAELKSSTGTLLKDIAIDLNDGCIFEFKR